MDYIKRFLEFSRITENGIINLTNLAVMVTVYKLFKTPVMSMTDTAALIVALSSHGFSEYNKT